MNSEWLLYVCVHVGWLPQYLKQASRYRFAPSLLPSLFSPPFSLLSSLFLSPLLPSLPSLLSSLSPLPLISTSSTQFQCLRLWCVYQYILHWSYHCSAPEHHILTGGVAHRQTGETSFSLVPRSEGGLGMRQAKPAHVVIPLSVLLNWKCINRFWHQCDWYMWSLYYS